MKRALAGIVLAGTFTSISASAAPTADSSAAAEDFFQRAKALYAKHDLAGACPLFLESYRLDPAGGTLQNLAVCYEESGRLASAYARWQELRVLSKNAERPRPDRVKLADEHITKLSPRLSRVLIVVPAEIASSATVAFDGATYNQPSWTAGILVDPGAHELTVTAPGKEPFHTTVSVTREGAPQEVRVPMLADARTALPPPASPAPSTPEATPTSPRSESHQLSTPGLVVGGIGAASLVAGGVFGILTFAKNNAAKDKCVGSHAEQPTEFSEQGRCYVGSNALREANAEKDSARTLANIANVFVGVGVVGLGVGAYLLFWHDDEPRARRDASVRLVPGLGGASVEGTF